MNNINKNMEMYQYIVNDKKLFIEYYHRIIEKGFTLLLTNTTEGFCFTKNENIQRGLDKYDFENTKYGFPEFFQKEQIEEIIQIEINKIRFELRQKENKMLLKNKEVGEDNDRN